MDCNFVTFNVGFKRSAFIVREIMKSKYIKSKTIIWGHLQLLAGMIVAGLGFFNPALFPDIEPKWYGVAAMVAGVLTYWLRSVTRQPLDEK